MKLKRIAVAAATIIGLAAAAGQAQAAQTTTFNGSCTFQSVSLSSDAGTGFFTSTAIHAHGTASGACTGTANGAALSAAPAAVDLQRAGRTSCIASMPNLTGSGTLTVAGVSHPVTATMTLTAGMFFTVTVSGASGTASGTTMANLIAAGTDPHSGLACLTNQTTEATLMPLTLSTNGPLVLG